MKKEWIDAAKLLANNPNLSTKCPDCGNYILEVVDVDSPLNAVDFERYVTCPQCKAQAVLKMKRKES
ncbi:hypothetical protein [Paenibacillus sp. MMO-58]|uniref:hypothetical protein n=1 Tax=Paenibacillus sp. MMO-58 TaxID=3081290 RepID=UPI003017E42C